MPARRGRASRDTPCRCAADGDAEPVVSASGTLPITAASQRLTKTEATDGTSGFDPGLDPPLDPAQIGLGRRHVLLAREQQRHVDRHAGEDRLLDRGQALARARDLDEEVGACGAGVQVLGRGDGGRPCRGPEAAKLPARPSRRRRSPVVDRAEQVGGLRDVLKRELEEERLARLPSRSLLRIASS